MHDLLIAATIVFVTIIVLLSVLPPRPRHAAGPPAPPRDTRSLTQRWEDGPDIGSMTLDSERDWRRAQLRARVTADAERHAAEWRKPRPGALVIGRGGLLGAERYQAPPGAPTVVPDGLRAAPPGAPLAVWCTLCEARDDQPHAPWCRFADDQAPTLAPAPFTAAPGLDPGDLLYQLDHQHAAWIAERQAAYTALRRSLILSWSAITGS